MLNAHFTRSGDDSPSLQCTPTELRSSSVSNFFVSNSNCWKRSTFFWRINLTVVSSSTHPRYSRTNLTVSLRCHGSYLRRFYVSCQCSPDCVVSSMTHEILDDRLISGFERRRVVSLPKIMRCHSNFGYQIDLEASLIDNTEILKGSYQKPFQASFMPRSCTLFSKGLIYMTYR